MISIPDLLNFSSDPDVVFLKGTLALATVIIPGAISLIAWRLHVTKRKLKQPNISVLGVSDAVLHTESGYSYFRQTWLTVILLYAVTSIITLELRLLAFCAYESLRRILPGLLY